MNPKVTIINKIDLEKHLEETWGDQPYRRESEDRTIRAAWDIWFQEIKDHFKNFPGKVSLEISGHPLRFRIRIARCAWLLRPFLWFKLRLFLYRNWKMQQRLEEEHRSRNEF